MNARHLIVGLLAGSLLLAGCSNTREDQGRVIGAIAGGVLGAQVGRGDGRIAATIAGTLLGGYLGGELGKTMDENDRYRTAQALETTRTHQSSSWTNPDSGYEYSVTPTRTFDSDEGPCREYTTEAWIDGRKQSVYGTACRQADGSWQTRN